MVRKRKQSDSWIHQHSRYLIAGIAAAGLVLSLGCLAKGNSPLTASAYVQLAGLSLPLLGALAYGLMGIFALLPLRMKGLETPTWLGLFMGSTAMTVFSGYLVYVMFAVVQEPCTPCLLSAGLSLGLWGVTLAGNRWDSLWQLMLPGLSVGLVALIATTGLHAYAQNPDQFFSPGTPPPVVDTQSGPSEIALAQHLTDIGAKKYGAWWCPHCHAQQTLFGNQAFEHLTYVECDAEGVDPQPGTCQAVGVRSYPTWEINGELYAGVRSLPDLASLSGYTGPQEFVNQSAGSGH
ncbi:MAG: vitamin K epoxide reductase family protein [Cyanobacteria bacterium J06648_16]